jgi:hypothetical protein
MKVRHHRPTSPHLTPMPIWSSTLPSWAIAPSGERTASRRLASILKAGRLRRRPAASVSWTCARCGAVQDSSQAAARHIRESHPGAEA